MEAKDYLDIALTRESKRLYISFLETLEDIKRQHDSAFFKLLENLPKEYQGLIITSNYLDDEAIKFFRKRALDHGNDLARSIASELQKYDIDFKR